MLCVASRGARVCSQKQTQNTQKKLKTLNIFLTGFKTTPSFLPKRLLLFSSTSIMKEHHSRYPPTSIRKRGDRLHRRRAKKTLYYSISLWNNGRVFYLALSSSSPAEAKTTQRNHRSGDVVHGVGETQVRGSSSLRTTISLVFEEERERASRSLARTKGERLAASLEEIRAQSSANSAMFKSCRRRPATRVAGEGTGDDDDRIALERRRRREARDDRETDETMKTDGYFNFDDNANNNKASEEKKSSASSLSSNDDRTAEEAKTKVELPQRYEKQKTDRRRLRREQRLTRGLRIRRIGRVLFREDSSSLPRALLRLPRVLLPGG